MYLLYWTDNARTVGGLVGSMVCQTPSAFCVSGAYRNLCYALGRCTVLLHITNRGVGVYIFTFYARRFYATVALITPC